MLTSKKRKSTGGQQTISKFFKVSTGETKPAKKLPIISISDDDVEKKDHSSKHETIRKDNSINQSLSLKTSFQKLEKFEIDSNEVFHSCPLEERLKISQNFFGISDKKKNSKFISTEEKIKANLTPLEKQFVEIKKQNKDTILFVECGYKYRFFGEDAEIASKELNIFTHVDHNFATASIPVHRLDVHMERLLSKGYKVGIVQQTETAALKAVGSNRNAPFSRSLTRLYTQATYTDSKNNDGHFIMALRAKKTIQSTNNHFDICSVNTTTGKIISEKIDYDFSLLDNMLQFLDIAEIIMLQEDALNKQLIKFIQEYKKQKFLVRIEVLDNVTPTVDVPESIKTTDSFILLYAYLQQFKLENLLLIEENYQSFELLDDKMNLNNSVFTNLEIFSNNNTKTKDGSLFGVLDYTGTPFGKRMLKSWLQQPLTNIHLINKRLDSIDNLIEHINLPCLQNIMKMFKFLPDLEKNFIKIHLQKCQPEQFIKTLKWLQKLKNSFTNAQTEVNSAFNSSIIIDIFESVPKFLNDQLFRYLDDLNEEESSSSNKSNLFKKPDKYPSIKNLREKIANVEKQLEDHKSNYVAGVLKNKYIEYKIISGLEYLIEVKNAENKFVPKDWIKISSTKQFTRYRTPLIDSNFKLLLQHRESLQRESDKVWKEFLHDFTSVIPNIKKTIDKIGMLDCLMSLSKVSKQSGFIRPLFTDVEEIIEIKDGRHPVIESFIDGDQQFVPNNIHLEGEQKSMLISGPNMGGKSSYIKQVAVICIMAHVGCYVPASYCKLSVLDGIYTRMGATDCMEKGKSTFMVELEEAAHIMKNATSKSLVILDELGRGTSTHDGTAIAYATLKYFIEDIQSFTLFVTHYTLLSEFEEIFQGRIRNYHMSFIDNSVESDEDCDQQSIIFLYKLESGPASRSYGLNVARLAGLDGNILKCASKKSQELYESSFALKKHLSTIKDAFQESGGSLRKLISSQIIE